MKPFESGALQDWIDDHIEAYVDDELSPGDREAFERVLAAGVSKQDVMMSRRIRDGLRGLPCPTLDAGVSRSVLERVRSDTQAGPASWLQWVADVLWMPVLRPVFSMALLLAVVLSAILIGRPAQQQQGASQAEVQRALAEAKWALAYVSHVGQETGSSVRSEVLRPHVVQPVQQVLGVVLDEHHETTIR